MLKTARMRLIPATLSHLHAEMSERSAFATLLAADVPINWPPESAADALPWFVEQMALAPTERVGWLAWYGIVAATNGGPDVLVGGAGFKGPPAAGMVETGYSLLPQFQRQGYATEMVGALVAWALAHQEVQSVVAETEHTNLFSQRLLAKLHFQRNGVGSEPDYVRYELVKSTGK